MELRSFLVFALLSVAVFARYTDAMSYDRHSVHRRDAFPEPEEDEDLMADAAGDEAMNDADGGDDDYNEEEEGEENVMILNKGEDFVARVGQSVRLPCTTNSKDAVIQWHKDDRLIFLGRMQTIHQPNLNLMGSDLLISDLAPENTGTYRCSVAGKKIAIEHTVVMTSAAKITQLSATGNGLVQEGTDVEITCATTGVPPPTLIWSREIGEDNVRLTERDASFSSNSITIKKIRHDQAGSYICYADNKLGPKPDAKNIRIKVLGKPSVHIPKLVVNTKAGVEALLQCKVHREPESQIQWYKDDEPVRKVEDVFKISFDRQHSNLTITPRIDKDFGTYTCKAKNLYGTHEKSVRLTEDPVIENLESDGPKLTWVVHSYLPLKQITLNVQNVKKGNDSNTIKVPIPESTEKTHEYYITHILNELLPSQYIVTVNVENQHGWAEHGTANVDIQNQPEPIVRGSAFGMHGASEALKPFSALMASLLMYILVRFI